jgi:hypothetical protein
MHITEVGSDFANQIIMGYFQGWDSSLYTIRLGIFAFTETWFAFVPSTATKSRRY